MADQTRKIQRTIVDNNGVDPSSISLVTYNKQAGAQKSLEMGPHLVPITTASGYTTNCATIQKIPKGVSLAIYNPTGSAVAVRLSNLPAAPILAIGAVDSANGEVGVAAAPNGYTFLASYNKDNIITGAGVFVFIVADDTSINDQAQTR